MRSPVHFFLGLDPQQSSAKRADDGCGSVGAAIDLRSEPADFERPVLMRDFLYADVYHRTMRGILPDQWSGWVHGMHESFGFSGIALDAGAGGAGIATGKYLGEREQRIPTEIHQGGANEPSVIRSFAVRSVRPIVTPDLMVADGQPILCLMKRGDPGVDLAFADGMRRWDGDDNFVDAMHTEYHSALEGGSIAYLPSFDEVPKEVHAGWSQERIACLRLAGASAAQLKGISVATKTHGDGHIEYAMTKHGAKQFFASGRKDLAYSKIYAWVAFYIWMRRLMLGYEPEDGEEGAYFAEV